MLWQQFQEILQSAPKTTYDAEGNGVPSDVIWQNKKIRQSDGTSHCSGAVFWGVCQILKMLTDMEERISPETIAGWIPWAWVFDGYHGSRKAGLPFALGGYGNPADALGTFFQNEIPQQGDICQVWKGGVSGHLIFCAGYQDGAMLEWSASESQEHGTGIKPFVGEVRELYGFRFFNEFFR